MENLTTLFFQSVGKHFLSLSCVQKVADRQIPHIFSGFLVEAGGAWFFISAGHILRDIQAGIDAGAEFDIWRLDDQTSRKDKQFPAIPFEFNLDDWLVIEDENLGLDYAAVHLREIYVQQLLAGCAEPISDVAWGDYIQDHDYWALIGIPAETVSYDGRTILTAKVAVIPLDCSEPPIDSGGRANNQFYATLSEMGNVKDLGGMSGGPIFSLKKTEEGWKYHLIGVQSGWYKSNKLITACPSRTFLDEISREVRYLKRATP